MEALQLRMLNSTLHGKRGMDSIPTFRQKNNSRLSSYEISFSLRMASLRLSIQTLAVLSIEHVYSRVSVNLKDFAHATNSKGCGCVCRCKHRGLPRNRRRPRSQRYDPSC